MAFIHPDFLLATRSARHLYRTYAAGEPILDYHNHLPPQDLAGNRQFANLFDAWLEGDHFKWRAMRATAWRKNRHRPRGFAAREVSGMGQDRAASAARSPDGSAGVPIGAACSSCMGIACPQWRHSAGSTGRTSSTRSTGSRRR